MNQTKLRRAFALLPLLPILCFSTLALTACGFSDDDDEEEIITPNPGTPTVNNTAVTSRTEVPAITESNAIIIAHWTMENCDSTLTYCLQYDAEKHHSKWVAYRFDATTRRDAKVGRAGNFMDDPKVSSALTIGSSGFGIGYDRGHLCASEDRQYSRTANEQTFYMTNMSPQISGFNQGYWVTLEGLIQAKGRDANFADTLFVVKGGYLAGSDLLGYISRSGGKRVAIPGHYFAALLRVKDGLYSSIAFWFEHKDYGYTYENKAPLSEIAKHAISVDELEEKTGIDFFANLPERIETPVEKLKKTTDWGFPQ